MKAGRHDEGHRRRPVVGDAIGQQLAPEPERVGKGDVGAGSERAHGADRLVVRDVTREVAGRGDGGAGKRAN